MIKVVIVNCEIHIISSVFCFNRMLIVLSVNIPPHVCDMEKFYMTTN